MGSAMGGAERGPRSRAEDAAILLLEHVRGATRQDP
jgi:hypothetical protein